MPINVPGTGSARTLVFGRGSHIKMAEQAMSGIKITDVEAFSKYKVAINSMTIVPTSTLLTPGVIPTTVEQFEGVPGPLSIAGNFVIDALPLRQELFFRQLLNAPSLDGITEVTAGSAGSHTGTGTAQTLLSNGTLTAPDSLDTDIDVNQGPVQLEITLDTGATYDGTNPPTAANPIQLAIAGTDYRGQTFSETVSLTTIGTAVETAGYFMTVTSLTPVTAAATGTYDVEATADRKAIEIKSTPGYRITPGMTMEIVSGTPAGSPAAGGTVNTVSDAYINTFEFSATREEIITYTFGVTGKLFEPNVNPAGGSLPFADSARTSGAGGPYGGGPFETLQDDNTPYAGYSALLRADNGSTPAIFNQVTGMSLTFDNNTQFTDRLGSIYPGVVYNRQRTGNLELTLEYHSSDTDFARAYLEADEWTDVELSLISSGGVGSFPTNETRFLFPKVQLSEYPSTPIESDDFVRQTIRGTILPTGGSDTDAIRVWTYGGTNHTEANLFLLDLS